MPAFAVDDLISLASDSSSATMTAAPLATSPPLPVAKTEENRRSQPTIDSFASLTSLMKSKKPWTAVPSPQPQRRLPVTDTRAIHLRPELQISTSEVTHVESASNKPSSAGACQPVQVESTDAVGPEMVTATGPACDRGYDEADMQKMERLIEEMRLMNNDMEQASEWEVVSNKSGAQVQPNEMPSQMLAELEQYQTESSRVHGTDRIRQDTFRVVIDQGQEPIVRLTPEVWDNMLRQITVLKKDKLEALAKISIMEREEHVRRQTESGDSTELDQLRYRVEVNKDVKMAMSRDIRQKDVELHKQNLEIENLREQVRKAAALQASFDKLYAENEFLRKQADEATETAKQKGADAGSFAQLIEFKDQENSRLTDIIARLEKQAVHTEVKLSGHQTRAENLADTQAVREKKLKKIEQQLKAAYDDREKLLDDLDRLKTDNTPLKFRIKELESQLREKTSACDRMRNDLKHTEKRLDIANKSLHKIENHYQLKGAAHAIVPSENTTLPKRVLPCMECFAKNITCDSESRCQNCIAHGEKCLRWKCSQVHILRGGCEDYPCMLLHDSKGWLMLKQDQPQW